MEFFEFEFFPFCYENINGRIVWTKESELQTFISVGELLKELFDNDNRNTGVNNETKIN